MRARSAPTVAAVLDDAVRALAEGPDFAAMTTLLPGGQPQTPAPSRVVTR